MKLQANGIELEVQVEGPPTGEPLLMVMGLGMQLNAWPQELVDQLTARGFRVIRFDNRDAGLSQGFDHLGVPNLLAASLSYAMQMPLAAPYQLQDMAADALGVLDALGIDSAHLCGASMGGMIAQHIAARHPLRTKSLSLVMTSSGSRSLPPPHWRAQQALIPPVNLASLNDAVDHLVRMSQIIGSPGYPPEPGMQRARLEALVRRSYRPAGTLRQMAAVAADGDRSPLLRLIRSPSLVIHGLEDPLVRPAAARDLLRKLPDARADLIPGMGHDLPLALAPRFAGAIAANAHRAADRPHGESG